MKKTYVLETLNTWGGRVLDPLLQHISKEAKRVDIFCFQEMLHTSSSVLETRPTIDNPELYKTSNGHPARANLFEEIQKRLSNYISFFHTIQDGMDYRGKADYDLHFGQAICIKNTFPILGSGDIFVYREKNAYEEGDFLTVGRSIEYLQTQVHGKDFLLCNFHGVHGNGKTDTPERIDQAKKVKAFLDSYTGAKILCGDFNLLPETQSMEIMERGMRNLVTEFGVTSSRSYFYEKPARFADYILVSPEVEVKDFRVLEDVVSDHLPLQVEFS